MNLKKYEPYLFAIILVLSVFLLYSAYSKATKSLDFELLVKIFSFQDMNFTLREFNKVAALAGIGLLSIAFPLGPLTHFFPRIFSHYLWWRKTLGLTGFALVALHSAYSFAAFFHLDIVQMLITNPRNIGTAAGLLGFISMTILAATSTKKAMNDLGYERWKSLQRTGYIGLALSVIHFFILETKPEIGLDVRPYGMLFFYLPILAILFWVGMIIHRKPTQEKKSFEEHLPLPTTQPKARATRRASGSGSKSRGST